jgi:hypothetical protein
MNTETQAYEKLKQLAALSGWKSALEALETIIKVDVHLASGGKRQ